MTRPTKQFFGKGKIALCKIVLWWLFCHKLCRDSNSNFSVTGDTRVLSIRSQSFLNNCKSFCHRCQCKTIFKCQCQLWSVKCQIILKLMLKKIIDLFWSEWSIICGAGRRSTANTITLKLNIQDKFLNQILDKV